MQRPTILPPSPTSRHGWPAGRHTAETSAETDHPTTFPPPGATLATALPNPASVLCASKAGASHTLTDSSGASWGVCSFGLSAVIDEWTLLRAGGGGGSTSGSGANSANKKQQQEAVAAFLTNKPVGAASNAAPASVCAKANAEVRTLKCSEPECTLGVPNVALCLFKGDGSMIGADALKAGPKVGSGGVAQLAAALQ